MTPTLVLGSLVAIGAAMAGWTAARCLGRPAGAPDVGVDRVAERFDELEGELARICDLVAASDRSRSQQAGELSGHLQAAAEQTAQLAETARQLREALSSSQARGQWGERMAEDVLRLAGLLEGINYRRQRALPAGGVPDFTFLLPRGMELHMDVKFPLDNYLRHLDAGSDMEAGRYRTDFLRDVRARVRELAGRSYLEAPGSVDCVLLFIPNEQLYAFIQEHAPSIAEEALRSRVVLCSPLTLFAVLAIVRQAVDNFILEQASVEILDALGDFSRQWEAFRTQMDRVGARLEAAQREFDALAGVRRRQLDRQVDRVQHIRRRRAVDAGPDAVERSAS